MTAMSDWNVMLPKVKISLTKGRRAGKLCLRAQLMAVSHDALLAWPFSYFPARPGPKLATRVVLWAFCRDKGEFCFLQLSLGRACGLCWWMALLCGPPLLCRPWPAAGVQPHAWPCDTGIPLPAPQLPVVLPLPSLRETWSQGPRSTCSV